MKILVSNDDGIHAPGIIALADSMAKIGDVVVIAPDRNRSGASNSLTLSRPLRVRDLKKNYYSVEGTPTDCVHLALTGLFTDKFDIVVSGINNGANLGDDILYSGTVAAAMEGRNLGVPAIAISLVGDNLNQNYQTAAIIVKQLVANITKNTFITKTILNVNIPDLPLEQIKGYQITRLGTRHCAESIIKQHDPRGRPIYWVGSPGLAADSGPGTDFHAIQNGYVSVTPLNLDMTHYLAFDQLASWLPGCSLK